MAVEDGGEVLKGTHVVGMMQDFEVQQPCTP
jgi:hypothetical protein